MVSINDVAKLAKVSKSTVSLVINNTGYVSENTKKKILAAMEELSYVPNQLGKNLSNRKSNIIGVVIPDITHPFFAEFVKALEKDLFDEGYMLMVCSTLGREKVELEYLKWLENYTIDGIIMGVHTTDISHYIKTKRPIVSLDRVISKDIPTVSSNHKEAAKITVEKLIENSCEHVLQFVGSSNTNVTSEIYASECKRRFEAKGKKMYTHVMKKNTFFLEDYFAEAQSAFKSHKKVDAFIGTDMIITQCEKIAYRNNINIPEELKLISYDGTQVTKITSKVISSVKQNINLLSSHCVKELVFSIENNSIRCENIVLPVTWEFGETTNY